ncbi:hypothetical protein DVR12_19555 [Chitinophaga silvatica]|uniref:Uncharacterized protein n=1 Tax=Chitinophaga silvatica TaxID=2282649 RepID=A0A3E1Y733_9BACT|nr:hypothetical protein [Chitinophaga silvatica]RFS20755.1 hypothetical protein DVR12_19555 [Chitinophaga silvatica]
MKNCFLSLLFLLLTFNVFAQEDVEMTTKPVKDTILGNRTLLYAGTFNAEKALVQLFPGKIFRKDKKIVINWTCPSCKAVPYVDENGDPENAIFPFKEGVATRLINEMDFTDANGTAYKVISFNHSPFDADGLQMVRFQGGVLGMAKFILTDNGWKLRMFTPAIGGYGSFSQAPTPKPVQIGDDQWAFLLEHINGGAGGAYYAIGYLIAGIYGTYKKVMAAPYIRKVNDPEGEWSYTVEATGDKKQFRDLVFNVSGNYTEEDKEYLPEELQALIKGKKKGSFSFQQKYVHNGRYYVQQKAVVLKAK